MGGGGDEVHATNRIDSGSVDKDRTEGRARQTNIVVGVSYFCSVLAQLQCSTLSSTSYVKVLYILLLICSVLMQGHQVVGG